MNTTRQTGKKQEKPTNPLPLFLPMRSILKMGIGSLVFFACFLMQLSGQFLQFQGIIAQVQVMVSIYIVVSVVKTGYILAIILNLIESLMVLIYIVINKNLNAISGVVVPLCTIITMTIISFFGRRLHAKMKEALESKEELATLYEEVSATHEELRKLAYYDELTNLPNRKMIMRELNDLCATHQKTKQSFAVVFMDLDNFKKVNDSLGHHVGDDLLVTVGTYLRKDTHPEDFVGRLGGDEFAFLVRQNLSDKALCEYMNELKSGLLKVFPEELNEYNLSGSFGISVFPRDGQNTKELLKCADIAMYQAKINGKNGVSIYQA